MKIPNGFKLEATYTDRSEKLRAFNTYNAAKDDLAAHNSEVRDRRDKCGPINWRLSVFDTKSEPNDWRMVCERENKTACEAILSAIIDAVRNA